MAATTTGPTAARLPTSIECSARPRPVGTANYIAFQPRGVGGVQGVLDLAQSADGARMVAVGDFTSVGTTGSLHGVAIFG